MVWEDSRNEATIIPRMYHFLALTWQYVQSIANKESSLKLQCQEVLLWLHYIIKIIDSLPMSLNLISSNLLPLQI